ncbi:WW domain-binding protein 4 [Parasteatoda tepidariorum]|uniref:WW domain-binding protein 4 n=1 Tax=Parasteatoda tepidariorum TaxID=114398 RepID=UPI00077FDF97|nr:WW domain-binding protein 4 [Parasteatoda tepidariorum]
MSEYWKSLPRKFCDICKCWFADNKASIDFHERGKRHQENAAKRIQDIQKRGIKEAKKQKKLDDDMAKIERAALAAFKKDLQNESVSSLEKNSVNSSLTALKVTKTESVAKKETTELPKPKSKNRDKKKIDPPKTPTKIWYEAVTEEGYKYYWNTENSESQWDPPEEGYVSMEEQTQANSENSTETETTHNTKECRKDSTESVCTVGPQPKPDPYGQWVTVAQEEPEEIDLQLPKPSEDLVEVVIPIATDEPKLKIKEKVIGNLTDIDSSEEVTFKKRKFLGSSKRNTRQRTDDDD